MERIKKAIEKAKAGRGQEKPVVISDGRAELTELTEVADVNKITYRKTRIIELDPLHLEES